MFVETAIKQNKGAIAFYETGIYELARETPQLSTLREPAKAVLASLKEYQKFLEEKLLPEANGDWRLGKEKFAEKLQARAEQRHRRRGGPARGRGRGGARRAGDVRHRPPALAAGLSRPGDAPGRRQGRQAAVITKVLDKVSTEHGKPEDLVKDATATVARIKTFIKERDILRLPEPDQCKIIEMPEFQRGNSIAYLNPAPPLDAKAASYYAISPPPREWDAEAAWPATCRNTTATCCRS